ncbi:MAG TPA: hypothetical protein VKD90_17860 [Gemmataceae bacterium]|nr:hypothetical protein [Gemmataceae bacterium]
MRRQLRFLGCAVLTAAGVAGCGQSPAPPAVVAGPAESAAVPQPGQQVDEPVQEPGPAKADAVPDGGSFPFPDDAGGKALAKTLTPTAPLSPRVAPAGPRERTPPDFLTAPAPAPVIPGPPPRLVVAARKEVRPTPLPERAPTDLGGPFPQLPPRAELPIGPGVRVPGRDPSIPPELPALSTKPVPDRAPLADPTTEFTARSVISVVLPLRLDPAVFVRINLPDPFEHAAAAKPRTPVAEDPNRSLGSAPPPRK